MLTHNVTTKGFGPKQQKNKSDLKKLKSISYGLAHNMIQVCQTLKFS